jgi:hypothetical protein
MRAGHAAAAKEHNAIAKRHLEKASTATRNQDHDMRRNMIPQAVINACQCERTRAYMMAENAKAEGSNADVHEGGGKSVQAGDEEDSDDHDYESDEGKGLDDGVKVGDSSVGGGSFKMTKNQRDQFARQMFGVSANELNEALQFTTNQKNQEKRQLIALLIANASDEGTQRAAARIYAKMPLAQLRLLASAAPSQMIGNADDFDLNSFGGRSRPLANFTGAGGGPDLGGYGGEPVDNEDQPIPPTINYKELSEENARANRRK